jgi:hypothetical protein
MQRGSTVPLSKLIRNQRGIVLLYLVIFFILIGVLVSAGVRKFGSTVSLSKTNDTKAELERDVQMITAWAVKSGKLPALAQYPAVFGGTTAPQDSWGRPVVYIFDNNLTDTNTGGLCGRTSTAISLTSGQVVPNVALLLLSSADTEKPKSTLNGSLITGSFAVTVNPSTIIVTDTSDRDLVRWVTLDELKAKAGCAGSTQGSLKILNNELPKACAGDAAYQATMVAHGGVPAYTWSLIAQSAAPWASILINPVTGGLSPNPRITSTPGNYNVTLRLADTLTSIQRSYPVNVGILGSCSSVCALDAGCSSACYADAACRAACTADAGCAAACPACVTP